MEPITLHRVIVCHPVTRTASGAIVGAPPAGSFDPALVRVTPASDVRPGDIVLGTIQPHYDTWCQPLDRARWVFYFTGQPTPQKHGARPFTAGHCDHCRHTRNYRGATPDWTSVDSCTAYPPKALLLTIPHDLA
ncbi:hypothetical protein [Streptomyces zhihengii]